MGKRSEELRIMAVGASPDDVSITLDSLRGDGYAVRSRSVSNVDEFELQLREQCPDVILWCEGAETFSLTQTMVTLARAHKDIPVIALRTVLTERDRIDALRVGAKDVVLRENSEHLSLVVERELSNLAERRSLTDLESRYKESQRTCFELLQSSRNAVAFVREGLHLHANPAYRQMFGYECMTELQGVPLEELVGSSDRRRISDYLLGLERSGASGELEVTAVAGGRGEFRAGLSFSRASMNGEDVCRVVVRDLSPPDRVDSYPARYDPLTGLLSHHYFLEILDIEIDRRRREGGQSVLILIELEHFRSIRETLGIAGNDIIIRHLAAVIEDTIGNAGQLARFADTTFTVLVSSCDVSSALELAETVRDRLESTISDAHGQSVTSTCSIGMVSLHRRTEGAQEALAHADISCRTAIHSGGNRVMVYEPLGAEFLRPRLTALSLDEISEAVAEGRLELTFQSIMTLHGDLAEVYQASARLTDELGLTLCHEELVNDLIEPGVAGRLDQWLVEQAVLWLGEPEGPGKNASLFLRLSDEALKDPTLLLHLSRLLRQTGVDGRRLIVEISQAAATGQIRFARGFVNALKRMDCGVALGSFGKGASACRNLRHLDVDFLKIDESVMNDLVSNTENQDAIKSIQELARSMKKATVASLVQDAQSLAILWQYGVNYVQGEYIQGPVVEIDQGLADAGHVSRAAEREEPKSLH